MTISKKAIVVLLPSLLFGFGAPAWSGTAEEAAPIDAEVVPVSPQSNTWLGMLNSVATGTDFTQREHKERCKASQLYSQHDVVGDPDACIMGSYSIGSGTPGSAAGVP